MDVNVRMIGVINNHDTRYVTLPRYWGEIGKKVLIHTVSNKELKLELVDE